jgi:hypothetical protein
MSDRWGVGQGLCSILDGRSRYIVNWDLRASTTEADIGTLRCFGLLILGE